MTVTATTDSATGTRPPRREIGPDVVRAVALIGVVVMNYHGYLLLRGAPTEADTVATRLFDPFAGPLSTRFAATFVLVAGVSVTLLTRSAAGDTAAMSSMRWRLVRRGIVLYVAGIVLDTAWPGTILPFYGAMFAVAGLVVTWRSRWILAAGTAAALAAAGISWWRYQQALDGQTNTWWDASGFSTAKGMLLDVTVNGTHPLLPWLAFFCTGIVVGRLLRRPGLGVALIAVGFTLFGVATLVADTVRGGDTGSGLASELASDNPFDRGLMYTTSALGSSLVAFAAISLLAEQFATSRAVDVLRSAGQMTLTLYVLHALVFNLVVDWLDWVRPTGLDTALLFALGYWVVALGAARMWLRHHRRGPLETVYRRLTA